MGNNEALKTLFAISRNRIPEQLVIQFTNHCNARCPQCGMRVTEAFRRSKLSVDETKRIIEAAALRGVRAVSFTGGEPLMFADELAQLIRFAGESGIPYIRTGTNGFLFSGPDKNGFEKRVHRIAKTLSDTPLRNLWISVDSCDPVVHETMRGLPGVIKGIEKALPVFHEHGIYPSINLGINRNIREDHRKRPDHSFREDKGSQTGEDGESFYRYYQKGFADFYRFAIDLGFTMVNSCYPMSVENSEDQDELNAVYSATSAERIVSFTAREKSLLFKALMDTIPEYRSRIRIFTPRVSLLALQRQYTGHTEKPYPCRGGIDFFFIETGSRNTFPCGYRGNDNFGKYWNLNGYKSKNMQDKCYRCDWECFRDPSEMFGPLLQFFSSPAKLFKKIRRDREYFAVWANDLKYYAACDFFNGRTVPDYEKMLISQRPLLEKKRTG